ncbi:hypothetical protein A9975_02105 [Cupriavidus sp. UME77]|nr:hypothetical protein [Cupriavidus sp. UME77]
MSSRGDSAVLDQFVGIADGTESRLSNDSFDTVNGVDGISSAVRMLNDMKLRTLKPTGKIYKVVDQQGLYAGRYAD